MFNLHRSVLDSSHFHLLCAKDRHSCRRAYAQAQPTKLIITCHLHKCSTRDFFFAVEHCSESSGDSWGDIVSSLGRYVGHAACRRLYIFFPISPSHFGTALESRRVVLFLFNQPCICVTVAYITGVASVSIWLSLVDQLAVYIENVLYHVTSLF